MPVHVASEKALGPAYFFLPGKKFIDLDLKHSLKYGRAWCSLSMVER